MLEIPIDGTLDLHTFRPSDVKELVPDYIAECRRRGILEVRIVHGKGTGALRETVHAILGRMDDVASFRLAGDSGGMGRNGGGAQAAARPCRLVQRRGRARGRGPRRDRQRVVNRGRHDPDKEHE